MEDRKPADKARHKAIGSDYEDSSSDWDDDTLDSKQNKNDTTNKEYKPSANEEKLPD
jgi:hypothetical protein